VALLRQMSFLEAFPRLDPRHVDAEGYTVMTLRFDDPPACAVHIAFNCAQSSTGREHTDLMEEHL
jgi:hypothetical protein